MRKIDITSKGEKEREDSCFLNFSPVGRGVEKRKGGAGHPAGNGLQHQVNPNDSDSLGKPIFSCEKDSKKSAGGRCGELESLCWEPHGSQRSEGNAL